MIYFDNAATTMKKPDCVVQAVTEAMCVLGNSGRGVHDSALNASRIIYDARVALAQLLGAESPDRIAFTANSTEALNMAIKGVLHPGDHVITTALEHNSVLRPLFELEDQGVELTILPADAFGNLCYEDFEKEIRPNTKAIVTTHGSNLTGNLLDIERIGAIAGKHQLIYIVDASQTAGVFDLDVHRMKIDILCFTAGTLNGHGIAGLGAAVRYLEETGLTTIRTQEQALMWEFYTQVQKIPGITIYGDFSTQNRCAIVALNIRDYDSGEVSDALSAQYGIATRPGAHCAPLMHKALGTVEQGAVRFSFSHFNTKEEINIAVAALRELAKEE